MELDNENEYGKFANIRAYKGKMEIDYFKQTFSSKNN